MLPTVRLQRLESAKNVRARSRYADLPARTEKAMICEAVTLPPRYQLPYHFEVRQHEMIEFIFRSEFPLDVHFASMVDYEAWVSRGCGPAKPSTVYTEALDVVENAIEFVAPDDEVTSPFC